MTSRRFATRLSTFGLLASCGPTAAPQIAAHDVDSRRADTPTAAPHAESPAAAPDVASRDGEGSTRLVAAWSAPIGVEGHYWGRCLYPAFLVDAEDRVIFAGRDGSHNEGDEEALFRGDAEGRIERITLGPKAEAVGELAQTLAREEEIVSLVLGKDRVLSATVLPKGLELTSRPALGESPTERRWIAGAEWAYPLPEGRWLIVDGASNHLVTTTTWPSAIPIRPLRPLPKASAHFREVYDVATQGSRWAARGSKRIDADLKSHLAVFDGETFAWSIGEEAFISTDHAFDDDGGLWISAITYQELWPGLGAARFPKPPRIPTDVLKAFGDRPRTIPGHIMFTDERIGSLFGSALRRVRVDSDRTIHTEDITDGLMLRYTPEGQLAAEIRYPGTAIVWPGPLLPDDHGMTVAVHVEGEVPTALRGHPDLPEGFIGATLLAHYDTRGHEVWSAPLGAGERVVTNIARTSDGYLTITLEESGFCNLTRWRLQRGGAPASPSADRP